MSSVEEMKQALNTRFISSDYISCSVKTPLGPSWALESWVAKTTSDWLWQECIDSLAEHFFKYAKFNQNSVQ